MEIRSLSGCAAAVSHSTSWQMPRGGWRSLCSKRIRKAEQKQEKCEEHRPVLTEEQHFFPKEKRHFYRLISKCDTPQFRFGHAIKGGTVIGT